MSKTLDDKIDAALLKRGVARQYRDGLRRAAARTGIGAAGTRGDAARLYVVELMAYYLGKGPVPISPRELSPVDLERWAKRRAWDELERDVDRLPALELSREPVDNVNDLERRRRERGIGVMHRDGSDPDLPPAA